MTIDDGVCVCVREQYMLLYRRVGWDGIEEKGG